MAVIPFNGIIVDHDREGESYVQNWDRGKNNCVDVDGFVEQPTGVPLLATPLPKLLDEDEWKRIKELNKKTTERIHDARLPT